MEGVDYSWGRPRVAELARAGKRFAIRYVSWDRTGKNLTRAEAEQLTAAGLAVVTNWEWDAHDQLGGRPRGVEHAREADRLHRACGAPPDRPIYFSTDFDASSAQLVTCYEYLAGAASVIGWDRVGVYGGYRTVAHMASRGVRWLWQTYAWSGGRWHPKAALQQYRNGVQLAGADTDLNRAMVADFGQWMVGRVPPGVEDDMPISDADADKIAAAVHQRENPTLGISYGTMLRLMLNATRPDKQQTPGAVVGFRTELRDILANQEALLADQAGQDVADRVRQMLDAQTAQLTGALEQAETERADLADLVRQVGSGDLTAEQVVDELGRRLAAASPPPA